MENFMTDVHQRASLH